MKRVHNCSCCQARTFVPLILGELNFIFMHTLRENLSIAMYLVRYLLQAARPAHCNIPRLSLSLLISCSCDWSGEKAVAPLCAPSSGRSSRAEGCGSRGGQAGGHRQSQSQRCSVNKEAEETCWVPSKPLALRPQPTQAKPREKPFAFSHQCRDIMRD